MIGVAYMDPLEAASELLAFIAEKDRETLELSDLATRIDTFMYALKFLRVDSVASIPQADSQAPRESNKTRRELIGPRFPELGLYWTILDSRMVSDKEGEIAVGDAIDDLADIVNELTEVRWYLDHHGRDEALAALRWRYEHHLWMHLMPLRAHLEEVIHSRASPP